MCLCVCQEQTGKRRRARRLEGNLSKTKNPKFVYSPVGHSVGYEWTAWKSSNCTFPLLINRCLLCYLCLAFEFPLSRRQESKVLRTLVLLMTVPHGSSTTTQCLPVIQWKLYRVPSCIDVTYQCSWRWQSKLYYFNKHLLGTYHVLIAMVRAENKTEKVSVLMEFTFW